MTKEGGFQARQRKTMESLLRSLALAPVEDEEITPETAAALDRARASLSQGEGIPHEDILREFGLAPRKGSNLSSRG